MASITALQKLALLHHLPQLRQSRFTINQAPPPPLGKKHNLICHSQKGKVFPVITSETSENHGKIRKLVQEFNPEIPIEEAFTPPSSWYTDPDFYSFELNQVFYRGWQPVGKFL